MDSLINICWDAALWKIPKTYVVGLKVWFFVNIHKSKKHPIHNNGRSCVRVCFSNQSTCTKVKPFCKVYFDVNKKNNGMCGCLVPHWVGCVYACTCLSSQSISQKVMLFVKCILVLIKKIWWLLFGVSTRVRGILFFLNFLLEMYLMLALATGMLLSLSSLEVTLLPLSHSRSYMY